ncbi:CmpA/NrtA family ABC transporter substrate-binding protein [Parasphingorhabdus sp.]|uniref:ABC transporter substrate-binding protein n=1 Tax=Parasphingorhabdus sp. TaxID=2709688 RepID=UPI00329738F2
MTGTVLNCGYVPLIDCAPLIIASELGFADEEGLDLNLIRQPSWSALRDMLALGHLDAAHMLSPLPIAMSLGMGGLSAKIDSLMVLSANGTVFGVSKKLSEALGPLPFGQPSTLLERFKEIGNETLRIGVPFPFSMHHLLLRYWAASQPGLNIEAVTVPPSRMADAIFTGHVDAFWVGEPWGSGIVQAGAGSILMAGSDVWEFAPEKVLAARHDWVEENPDITRRLMRAVFQAGRWLDVDRNKPLATEILSRSEHLNLSSDLIDPAISGHLVPALGAPPIAIERFLVFHSYAASFPWRSQAALIAQQFGADAEAIEEAKQCFRTDLYRENLGPLGADLPGASEKLEGSMRVETAVSSTRGDMILAPDAFFDSRSHDFSAKGAN